MHRKILRFEQGFRVGLEVNDAQAAELVIQADGQEGGPDNFHQGADQWVFVVSGRGAAIIDGKRVPLTAGTLLVIERGEHHQLRNTGSDPLKILNFYSPPAFNAEGDPVGPGTKG